MKQSNKYWGNSVIVLTAMFASWHTPIDHTHTSTHATEPVKSNMQMVKKDWWMDGYKVTAEQHLTLHYDNAILLSQQY